MVSPKEDGGSELTPPPPYAIAAIKNGIPPADVVLSRNRQLSFEL